MHKSDKLHVIVNALQIKIVYCSWNSFWQYLVYNSKCSELILNNMWLSLLLTKSKLSKIETDVTCRCLSYRIRSDKLCNIKHYKKLWMAKSIFARTVFLWEKLVFTTFWQKLANPELIKTKFLCSNDWTSWSIPNFKEIAIELDKSKQLCQHVPV